MEYGSVQFRVIVEPEEGALIERLIEGICSLAGFDLSAFRAAHPGEPIRTGRFELTVNRAEGLTNSLFVIEARASSKKEAAAIFNTLVGKLEPDDRGFLARTLESRIDEDSRCFVRLDKKLFLNGVFALVDHGKCVHLTFTVLTYPRSREGAIRFVEKTLADE
jgi:RNA binding exosome subunit